ncbi:MAG: GNAT family N-acetyltransferase [Planctomycetota bacterium]
MAVRIRRFRDEDTNPLATIFFDAVHAVDDRHYAAHERAAWAPEPRRGEAWRAQLAERETLVAEVDGEIAGFLAFEPWGRVDFTYVAPAFQRRGVARALHDRVRARAEERRLGRLVVEASHVARPFFESEGYRVVRRNEVERHGVTLSNWIMELRLVPLHRPQRIFVVGNAGSGKSTAARALGDRTVLEFDTVAFADEQGTRLPADEVCNGLRGRDDLERAVLEGCYADLVEGLASQHDHLIWLDVPVDTCVTHARARTWEPHKWKSAAAQDAFLPQLIEFIERYPDADGPTGRRAHETLFESFPGTRERHREAFTPGR